MTSIVELIESGPTVSVELWPARSVEASLRLESSLERLSVLAPSFASITYGAGGSTRERTHDLVMKIQAGGAITPMAHLVTAAHRRADLEQILHRYLAGGVHNVLALRGDAPLASNEPMPDGELSYAIELVELAKSLGPFCVAVAAHPSGHPDARDLATDRRHLAAKLAIADFAITQFFYEASEYFGLLDDLRALGVDKPVVPGIMPIVSLSTLARMPTLSGKPLPADFAERFEALADRPADVAKLGVEVSTLLCEELIESGAPGLHFYTMNQLEVTLEVCANLGLGPSLAN